MARKPSWHWMGISGRAEQGPSPLRDPLLWLAIALGPLGATAWLLVIGLPDHPPVAGAPSLLLFVIAYPVLEEFVFRGLLQGYLLERLPSETRWRPVSLANILTATAFALAHLPRGGAVLMGAVLIPGLIFGFFRERHGTVATPMILHVFYNGSLVAVISVAIQFS